MCSGSLWEPGVLEQLERVISPFLCVQHSSEASQPQGAHISGSQARVFCCWVGVFCIGVGVCCLGALSVCFKQTDVLWVCLHLPLSANCPFVMVTGQMSRWTSSAPSPILPYLFLVWLSHCNARPEKSEMIQSQIWLLLSSTPCPSATITQTEWFKKKKVWPLPV